MKLFLRLILLYLLVFAEFCFGGWSGSLSGFYNTIGSTSNVGGNKAWGEARLKFQGNRNKLFFSDFSIATQVNDLGLISVSVHELNLTYNRANFSLSAGRSILPWSELDSTWGIGALNNRENFNFYKPLQEGLTGINFSMKSKNFGLDAFGSYLYIPELNPATDLDRENKTVGTRSPWVNSIPTTTTIPSNPTVQIPIYFNIPSIDYASIIFNYSFGLNLRYSTPNFSINAFAMRKPENQVSTLGNFSADVQELSTSINIYLNPQIFYQTVGGANVAWKINDRFSWKSSFLVIKPDKEPLDSNYYRNLNLLYEYTKIKGDKVDQTYLSTGVSYDLSYWKFSINYLSRLSKYQISEDLLAATPRWNQVINLYVKYFSKKPYFFEGDVKVDMLSKDRVIDARVGWIFHPHLRAMLGVRIIGVNEEEESFWKNFRNNDAVYLSGHFVF
jgi:hypothetical protein